MTDEPCVLITGAAHRVGARLAHRFAALGWHVVVHYNTSQDAAEKLAKSLKSASTIGGDLSDHEQTASVFSQLDRPVHCLINNASLFDEDRVDTMTRQSWDDHLSVNLRAPAFLASAFAAQLPDGMDGNVINIIDQRVWKPTPQFFSYGVSKAGLWAATKTMAQALAPRIRVNAIGPGPVLQSIPQTPEQFAAECGSTLLQRGTSPDEIADAIFFILDAPAMTGQMIALDGGQHLAWKTPDIVDESEAGNNGGVDPQ